MWAGLGRSGRTLWTVQNRFCQWCRGFTSLGSHKDTDTIYALCSGQMVKCGVSVIRISGSNAFDAVRRMTSEHSAFPEPRKAVVRNILDAETKEVIDKGMVICFEEGASYTDEKVVEFHLHGSPAVVAATLKSLSRIPLFRSANPGEFTKRAFLNGKMSFVEVEALGDLLNAETELQRKQAMRGVNGELVDKCWKWRSSLMRSLAHAETLLDFADDVDEDAALLADATPELTGIRREMERLLAGFDNAQLVRSGVRVTLCGRPNAGKSSLLNVLVGSDLAIVSAAPGTTRDVLRADMDLGGCKVVLQDTAGLRASGDAVEREGVSRAVAAARGSWLRLVIVDVTGDVCADTAGVLREVSAEKAIVVLNKIDQVTPEVVRAKEAALRQQFPAVRNVLAISCKRPETVSCVTHQLECCVKELLSQESEATDLITRERQRNCLQQCVLSLTNCINLAKENIVDLQAEELRMCLKSLAQLTGEVDVEEILDIVFSEFCIGK